MKNPCIGCKKNWHAGRGTSCQEFCQRLAEWRNRKLTAEFPKSKEEMVRELNRILKLNKDFRWGNMGKDKIRRIYTAILELVGNQSSE